MRTQRNRPQMKEPENSPKELDEMEASNLSDSKFRVMIIRILNSMKKETETIKKGQSEIKNALASVTQWIERGPVNHRVASLIPSQGTCRGCRPGPQ